MAYSRDQGLGSYYKDQSNRGSTRGRNRDRIRNARNNYTLNRKPSKFNKAVKKGFNEAATMGRDVGNKVTTGVKNIYDAAAKFGKYINDNQYRARENERVLGRDLLNNMRESVMTQEEKDFEEKYLGLAALAQDNEKRDEYLKVANSARRNAQISDRINFGLSEMGMTKKPFAGYESYQKDFTGGEGTGFDAGSSPRFSQELFDQGLQGTAIGKAFMAEANKARDKEVGDSLIGNEMKSFGSPRATFTSPSEINRQINSNAVLSEDILPTLPISNQPNMDDYNQIISPPFNAADIYGNLNLQGMKNKIFPGMNLEDITQEDLNNLSLQDKLYLGYTG